MIDLIQTPIGKLYIAAGAAGISAIEFEGEGLSAFEVAAAPFRGPGGEAHLAEARRQLQAYFDGKRRDFDLPLDLSGLTAFQKLVYSEVIRVPFGETRTYAQIAALIGRPNAYRAVGRANATNPFPVVIPCHRLVGADGDLRGYGGGLHRKAWLLAHESGGSRVE